MYKRQEWAKALDVELGTERAIAARLRDELGNVQEREAAMERMQERMLEELAGFRRDLSARDERIEAQRREHEARIAELESQLSATRLSLQSAQHRLREQRQSLGQWVDYAGALERSSRALLGSASWRLTGPLRSLVALARGADASVGLPSRPAHPQLEQQATDALPVAGLLADTGSVAPPPAATAILLDGIAFAQPASPQVSIVVPTYGKLDYTARCLRAIAASGDAASFEVIVLEDASGDPAMAALRNVPGLRYHENPENLGFLKSCNQSLALARGRHICLLNNDTEPQPGWLDALLATFQAHPRTGLVGAKLVYPDGRLQEAGGIVWSDATAWNYGRLQDPNAPQFCYAKEVDYVSGAAIVLPADVWRQLGGFDEHFLPAYCEDTDLAFRVRAAGMEVRLQPEAVVVHHEGISHGTDTGSGVKAWQPVNQARFAERWAQVLARGHFANAELPFLARDRANLRKTLLVIDHYVPQPDRDAGSRTMWQFMRMCQARGMVVKFWPENLWRDPVYTRRLQQAGIEVLYGDPLAGRFADWLREADGAIDYVLLSRPHVSVEFIEALRAHSDARLLYYGHDIHALRLRSQHALTGDAGLLEEAGRLAGMEERVWRGVDAIYYPSAGETGHVADWLRARGLHARADTIPVYAFDSFPDAPWDDPGNRRDVLFVAGFAHGPNVDAAQWLVDEVRPRLLERAPGTRILLVGSNPDERVRALAGEDVVVTGAVSDEALADHYRRARVAVAPLRYGGGMKGKVIEAMRHGLPCVTTAIGQQGLEDTTGLFRVADQADAFAEAIVALMRDDAEWTAMSRAAQAHARLHYSEQALWEVVSRDIDPTPYADVDARRARIRRRHA